MESAKPYPGDATTAEEMLQLARQFERAALYLLEATDRPGKRLFEAPCRLAAIHAIELYLNALLLSDGQEMSRIRGMQHDLAARASLAREAGLVWRKRTEKHLSAMTANREYLAARYEPGTRAATSEINRLTATLNETASKVLSLLETQRPSQAAAGPKSGGVTMPIAASENFRKAATTPAFRPLSTIGG